MKLALVPERKLVASRMSLEARLIWSDGLCSVISDAYGKLIRLSPVPGHALLADFYRRGGLAPLEGQFNAIAVKKGSIPTIAKHMTKARYAWLALLRRCTIMQAAVCSLSRQQRHHGGAQCR